MSGARQDIIDLVNLYGIAMDSQRWELFEAIFTDYVDADYGPGSHWRGLADFRRDFAAFHAPFDATQHMMTTHVVRLHGEQAHCLTYGSWRLVRHAAQGGPLWDGTGWYDDELVLTHAGWRIRKRVCRVIFATGNPRVKETLPGVTFEDTSFSLRDEDRGGQVMLLRALDAREGP
ncbi:MAG: nuclear transport factor 2 family protein [Sphingomonadales bacterium]|nr:nuclear transport factor 2 family protein [Sphingomonadales bacterium]